MNNEGILKNVIGALVSIKVIETGTKLVMKQRNKIGKEGLLYGKKKGKVFY